MGIKAALSKAFAAWVSRVIAQEKKNAVFHQGLQFNRLIVRAKNTAFGRDHHFASIKTYADFKKHVPVRDYEALKGYIERVKNGEAGVLWPGKPQYLSKTSGTTSGTKYIPLTKDSLPEHIKAARNALLSYIHETGNASFVDGKMIFLQGSPELDEKSGVKTGRLSGIVAHHVPKYLQRNRMPSYAVNCIDDWEEKVDAIVEETLQEDMRLISGIPPWCQMYFDRLSARDGGKLIKDIFPNFSVYVYGGVNYEPYRARMEQSIGFNIDTIETYPASEGFIAYQDSQTEKGLLLLTNAGMFYEFIPADQYFDEHPERISLADVEIGKNYALILNTNAGLWGYSIGDTIRFVSKDPYRIVVTGRIKHFISAFGEHVIGEEVEHALLSEAKIQQVGITEFTVAPQVNPGEGELPYHEWFIEFSQPPADMEKFARQVDEALQQKNTYYYDLIQGKVLQPLRISPVKNGAFVEYMRTKGKLGGQNKVPRLANDRSIANDLHDYLLTR
ncbi:MAG: GH3 auxin-responsive promoter family protein [Mucilaginibacter polytrichastri]|nr:GH3 auxin-responsive promoter family protein [Mucilaginibacter polytrichastri]